MAAAVLRSRRLLPRAIARGILRAAARGVIAIPLVAVMYLAAAVIAERLPVNPDFVPTAPMVGGIPIVVRSNGYHAEIVVPARGAFDWSAELSLPTVAGRTPRHAWVAFGWGDQEVYANTPTLRDLRPGPALVALSGLGRGAVHVQPLAAPELSKGQGRSIRVHVSPAQYRQLVDELRGSLARDAGGSAIRLAMPGQTPDADFYAAREQYTALRTCNEWVRQRLANAGVRMPRWAPFDGALFTQLEATGAVSLR